jgi:CheY-like chemotaxis protein
MSAKKILIIDDDVDFVESTRVVLEAKGYKVSSAGNRDEGFEKVKQIFPDLILMDVMMEKMSDGFDLSRKLKSEEKYKDIPILMLTAIGEKTGFGFSDVAGDKLWLPVDDYAEKPVSPEKLIAKVEKLL